MKMKMTKKEAIANLKGHWTADGFVEDYWAMDMAIEALEAKDHKCENCDHKRNRDFEQYWCNERMMWVDDDMHCSDWSVEE